MKDEDSMAPKVEPVQPSTGFPARTNVVIIGGGIIGVTAALFLARSGIPVTLCEKGHIAGEQSSRNWGWTRVMGRDERELPLGQASLNLWGQMNEMTGRDTGFRQCGILYACDNEREMNDFLKWKDIADRYQIRTEVLDPARTAEKAAPSVCSAAACSARPMAGPNPPWPPRPLPRPRANRGRQSLPAAP
ncbi:FAD-dependent oxidoreductase [Komagataeibacter rhaeticus]|nr:FAD-dependent oxidoreductase [Komagataeibacter rhaeticus]